MRFRVFGTLQSAIGQLLKVFASSFLVPAYPGCPGKDAIKRM